MPTRHSEREHRITRPGDPPTGIGRFLWAAILGLALLSTAGGALLVSSLTNVTSGPSSADRSWQTGLAASGLLMAERRLERKLVVLAADDAVARLADGINGSAERALAQRSVRSLEDPAPAVVHDACIVRPGDGRVGTATAVSIVHPREAFGPACVPGTLAARAAELDAGDLARERPTALGGDRLLVATPLTSGRRMAGYALVAEIDLGALFAATPAAVDSAAGAMLVDVTSHEVVARVDPGTAASTGPGGSQLPEGAPLPVGAPLPEGIETFLAGILSGEPTTARILADQGWTATFAPVLGDEESQLGVVQFWPIPAAADPTGLALGLAFLGADVLIIAAVFVARRFLRPVQELAESEAKLQVLYREAREVAIRDGLTELGNHRAFRDELARHAALSQTHGISVVLMLIDLDDLKTVNDADGHAAGDAMIEGFARTMREVFRESDLLFRIGGDEFAVIRAGVSAEESAETARRLLHFASRPSGDGRPCTFSCGISSMPRFGTDPTTLYRQADAALYWVKRHGRASVELFDPERDSVDQASFKSIDSAVYEVVRGRLLTPVFQPIVDLGSGSIIGFEGLIRPDPTGPLPDPGRLFAAAMTTGRTVELDIACLAVVSAGAQRLRQDQLLSVNLSPRTLELRTFDVAWLLDGLHRHGIDPRRVIVELTERDAIADLALLRRNFDQLQLYGIRFAADDVGAGNSGLRLLSQLRFDVVKIDLTLVQEGVAKLGSREVLRSIRDLARRQDALVIAEGVETPEQLKVVRELGISAGQGYLLGRPSAAVEGSAVELESLMPAPPAPEPPPQASPAETPSADGSLTGTAAAEPRRTGLVLPGSVEWPAADLARSPRARALAGGAGAALRR